MRVVSGRQSLTVGESGSRSKLGGEKPKHLVHRNIDSTCAWLLSGRTTPSEEGYRWEQYVQYSRRSEVALQVHKKCLG